MLNLMSNLRISTHKLEIERGRYTKPHPKPADKRYCMVCRTDDIEDEIHFLGHCEGYKDLRSNFIRYLELNDHTTNLEDSDSVRDLFRTKKTNILIIFGKFIAECYQIRETSSNDIWNVGGMYACFCLSCENCIYFGNNHASYCSPIKIIILLLWICHLDGLPANGSAQLKTR